MSQDPALTAEAWDHRGFGLQPSQAIPGRARRDLRTCQLLARRVHITPPIVAARPASHAPPEIPGRCEGRGRAASASRRVRSPARGEGYQLADGKIKLRDADNRVAAGRDLQDHELVAAAGAHGSQPMRSAELKKLRAGRGNVFKALGRSSLSTGGASARGATVPVSALRSESRPTPRRGPPRRGRRSRRQKARRDQRSSRTKISWHPAHSISSGDDGRGSRRTGV